MKNRILNEWKGRKVVVRSHDAGVYYGTLEDADGSTVRLSSVRNIWHWTGANCLADVAEKGITGDKVSRVVSEMVLLDVCQVLPCSAAAIANLEGQPVWTA